MISMPFRSFGWTERKSQLTPKSNSLFHPYYMGSHSSHNLGSIMSKISIWPCCLSQSLIKNPYLYHFVFGTQLPCYNFLAVFLNDVLVISRPDLICTKVNSRSDTCNFALHKADHYITSYYYFFQIYNFSKDMNFILVINYNIYFLLIISAKNIKSLIPTPCNNT